MYFYLFIYFFIHRELAAKKEKGRSCLPSLFPHCSIESWHESQTKTGKNYSQRGQKGISLYGRDQPEGGKEACQETIYKCP